jgi:hypothetical protein
MVSKARCLMAERLGDLERTVDVLHGRLREVQEQLQRVRSRSLGLRLWRNLTGWSRNQDLMVAVGNRRARPNMKVVIHDNRRALH